MGKLLQKRVEIFWKIWRKKHCYLFMLPTMVLVGIFSYYPVFSAFYHSFFKWDGYTQGLPIGFGNYIEMIHDPVLITSIGNMLILLAWSIIRVITVPLFTAEAIFWLKSQRAGNIYRFLFVAPIVIPAVVGWLIWEFFYNPAVGFFNVILGGMGLPTPGWLSDPNIALYCLMFIGFPWVDGVAMLIYLAGLQNIPLEIFDAVRIDGASGLGRFFKIDVPLIIGQIKLLVILAVIGSLQGFALQVVTTNGGPGYATMVPALWMYLNATSFLRMGYACAIGVSLFLIIFVLTYINVRYIRSSIEYKGS